MLCKILSITDLLEVPMKNALITMLAIVPFSLQALDFEVQMDNEQLKVSKIAIMPGEEIGLHRDDNPRIIISAQGGTITRIEPDDKEVHIHFPAGKAIFMEADPEGELHRAKNEGKEAIEIFVIELKHHHKK